MSRLPFELLLALRYLRPKRTFVSVITLISIIGVMLGVAVLIVVISVMSGFDKQLRDKILGFNAHLHVMRAGGGTMKDFAEPMSKIAANKEIVGTAPFVMGQVLVETQPAAGNPHVLAVYVRGVDLKLEGNVSDLPRSIIAGTNSLRSNSVWVGRDLARQLELSAGDKISIFSVKNFHRWRETRKAGVEEVVTPAEYEVNAIFDVGYFEYNFNVIVTSLANAQDLYDLNDDVHGLSVKLHDPYQAEVVRNDILRRLGADYAVTTWAEENSTILDALMVEKNVQFYMLFFIMIVAAFGITSALITFVIQKTREIGMLKALGANNLQVGCLFLGQSLVVGVFGVASGLGLGLLAVTYRNEFLAFMRRVTHIELFPARLYNFSELPAIIIPSDLVIICGGSLFVCVLAGLIPAWSAGRLQPVEALRHE